ncbi:1-phosphofructokinase [Alkaliphilus peptidifermentans]|uniref:Tagatose-6-phosphate kinase n=1 Tax=Alkaliphilus peptidifermentans DSM 18978 TaxID=1120976 RepID=A0A1G5F2J9_9FIRM|nr:1-phosphofructokinase [Alkaliphilus peptidifermentans]SCY33475.1 fructose-1-phosphate kinase [Alkaliphilus peptidifermentans DSM 18978]
MITTVTLNPAVDKTVEIDGFNPGEVNRILNTRLEPGGKGINVSKVLRAFGTDTLTTGFVGGENGKWIDQWLKAKEIHTDFVWIDKETRTNIKIVDIATSTITDINDKGKKIHETYLTEFYKKIEYWAEKSKVMVFSGSTPDGLPITTYTDLIRIAQAKGCKAILDAEGDKLLEGINAKPYMIKPNIHELENLLNVKFNSEGEIVNYCKGFMKDGIKFVVVSMGENGALLVSNKKVLKAEKVSVEVKSTVGAGDSMVAAFAYGIMKNLNLEDTFRLAVAAASLSVNKGTTLFQLNEVEELKEKVRIISME